MEKFPQLNGDQVALLRAEVNTGIILDENYIYATKEEKKVYTVFESLEKAIEFAKTITQGRPNVEYGIYGEGEVFLFNVIATT